MAEKMNISFRIRAVDNFTKTMKSAQLQLERLKREANEHMSSYITVSVLDGGVINDLDAISNHVDRLRMEGDVDIKTSFDNAGIMKVLAEFEEFKKERPKSKTVVTRFTTKAKDIKDIENLHTTMKALRDEADEFGKLSIGIDGLSELSEINKEMKDFNKNIKGVRGNVKKPLIARIATEGLDKVNKDVNIFKKIANDVRSSMARMANTMRTFGELFQHTFISGFLALAPIAVPAIASVASAMGALLPIIGTAGGGVMAMATSFGLAGAGAVAFGALATSALGGIFETSKKISELNKELANTTDEEKRIEILHEISHAQDGLNEKQKEGLSALQALKGEWGGIAKALAPQVIDTFVIAMGGLQTILQDIAPMFESVSTHAQNLVKWLNAQIDTSDVQAFYDMLNTTAGPSMERMAKALTNFLIGIGNLMVAFAPLAVEFEKGFLKMSESFREWTAGLGGSDKFQAFIDYVKENGPKLLTILGNIVGGFVGMGIAFAPFAEDMLDGLVKMTEKFKEWGEELKNNKGFQEFIKYAQENGPAFLTFLREFRDMLINIGIAFAPLGEWVMGLVTNLMELGNEFFENDRQAGELIAKIVWATSVFAFFYPIIMIVVNVLKNLWGVFQFVWKVVKTVWTWVKKLKPVWTMLTTAFRFALPYLLRTIGFLIQFAGPIGMIIKIALVLWGLWHTFGEDIKKWTKDMVDKVKKKFDEWKEKIETVVADVKTAFDVFGKIDLYESGKKIINSLIDGVKAMGGAVARAIGGIVGSKIRDFLPFSPAKRGPLRDLDKLNFGGPIIDSIKGDGPRIAKAMNSLLQAPEFSASNSVYSARSAGYRSQDSQTQSMREAFSEIVIESAGVFMDEKEVGRATFKATTRNQDRDASRRGKFKGGSATV